jgi:exosortase/archaeosortase family protein
VTNLAQTPTQATPSRGPQLLRVALFLGIYGLLHWAYQALRGSAFDPWFIHTLTARPAATLIGWLAPLDGVAAAGSQLVWASGRLTLLAGCDGFEVISLFVAAVLVADVPWRRGFVLLVLGVFTAWTLNQLRIAALYGAFRYQREWFDPLHTLWGPLVLIACVAAVYAWGVGLWPRRAAGPAALAGP